MDIGDRAQACSDMLLKAALKNAKLKSFGQCPQECEHCGKTIPKARRDAMPGCTLCVTCQEDEERRQRAVS